MALSLPSFLKRRLLLHEARRALLGGAPAQALEHLGDPCLGLSPEADRLRERALDVLCREAGRARAAGRESEAERILARVALQDPERARIWRRRLDGEESRDERSSSGLTPEAESGIVSALERLLREMRAHDSDPQQRARRSDRPPAPEPESESDGVPVPEPAPDSMNVNVAVPESASSRPVRFHLSVDDAGEFLVVCGAEVVFGHARAERADLPFLADLDARHARILRSESFHGGPGWRIEPVRAQRIEIGGQPIGPEGALLCEWDEVRLASNLGFRFRVPVAASGSGLLELLHGAECEGAARILLMTPGPAGRLRFGARRDRHVPVRGLEREVTLELDDAELIVSSEAGLRVPGAGAGIDSAGGAGSGADPPTSVRVPCPPARRVDFVLGGGAAGRPPFGFSIRAVDGPASGDRRAR